MSQSKLISLTHDAMPLVAIDFMNNTHREEVSMVKELGELLTDYQQINSSQTKTFISEKLHSWIEHTKNHFAAENELMKTFRFPAYPMHAGEHERALQQVSTLVEQWQTTDDPTSLIEFIFEIWPDWFVQHVNTMDTMTAKFAKMNGYQDTPAND